MPKEIFYVSETHVCYSNVRFQESAVFLVLIYE